MTTNPSPDFARLLKAAEPARLGPQTRAGAQPEAALRGELAGLFRQGHLPRQTQELIQALVLLWHDHLDAAHTLAQAIDTPDGAFVHGIMHRREPDYGNAAYWFRRVGAHPTFPEIARRAAALLEAPARSTLRAELIRKGAWDPFAFIDACERASGTPESDALHALLRALQRIEFEVLLEAFCQ